MTVDLGLGRLTITSRPVPGYMGLGSVAPRVERVEHVGKTGARGCAIVWGKIGIPLKELHLEQRDQVGAMKESGIPSFSTISLESGRLGGGKGGQTKSTSETMKPLPG